ncbi:MAG: hypothetical protein CMF46_01035 [Legionellales bacterium]|nr:hypothetical protein [Legionellales bacterium]|tara:strand:- start:769 stop:1236 length:468 start_codon:yes stop_codon:yes gene_type:complete
MNQDDKTLDPKYRTVHHYLWQTTLKVLLIIAVSFSLGLYAGIKLSQFSLVFDSYMLTALFYLIILLIIGITVGIIYKHIESQLHPQTATSHTSYPYYIMVISAITLAIIFTTIAGNYYLGFKFGILLPGIVFFIILAIIGYLINNGSKQKSKHHD